MNRFASPGEDREPPSTSEFASMPTEEADDDVLHAIRMLEAISVRLRALGLLVAALTVSNLGVVVAEVVQRATFTPRSTMLMYLLISGGIALTTLVAVSWFDSLRKRGNVLFQEVSDELQWFVGRGARLQETLPPVRPLLSARVALRSFASAGELPLVPGRLGPAGYAVMNVVCVLTAAVVYSAAQY
jgi:hypothetical protein